jgi:hypothetical protein
VSLFDSLLARTGANRDDVLEDAARKQQGRFSRSVIYTGEFRRIESLPRRQWETDQRLEQVAEALHNALAKGSMRLWPAQVAALYDIFLRKGAFLPIGVGQGKALISLLAPVMLTAQRPVLFVPAQLREQTKAKVLPLMRKHWLLHDGLQIFGYSELSLAKNAKMLEQLEPDLIILDECHRVKNKRAGRTRRLVRWFRENPHTRCVAMSGTISNRSLKDFAHIIEWCLGNYAPVPCKWQELTEWADAIDEKVENPVGPGALLKLCNEGENVRQGFRRRLTDTPGVVATSEDSIGNSLRVEPLPVQVPADIAGMLQDLREMWETPNGDIISEAVELWRHARELALGFWYRWDPPAPREWLDARREWKAYVRETLKHNQRKLDTELQVWNECTRKPTPEWQVWKALKDTFKPNTVAEWVHPFAVEAAGDWLASCTDQEPGICWIDQVAFGQELASHSGAPYFGAGDSSILDCKAPAIIASIHAHSEGKNLQRYCRNLVTAPMSSGKAWEQMLGRTHRQGQLADEVTCEVFFHAEELRASFDQALADARYLEDALGNRQKLNYADIVSYGDCR